MGTLVDTNVLVASRNQEDALHAPAQIALRAAVLPLIVHEYVALETTTVLMQRANKETADQFIRAVLGNSIFTLLFSSESSFVFSADSFVRTRGKLSFTDATLLALSDSFPVLTFDKELEKAIKKRAA